MSMLGIPPSHLLTINFGMGGNTRKPALANAPITHPTEIVKRVYARESESHKDRTTSPMNMSCFGGRAALTPTMRVAIAKKKDMELKNQNICMIG
jgi:hypothetical protein